MLKIQALTESTELEEMFYVVDLTSIDEGAGNLKGLSGHIMKTMTRAYRGEHSPVQNYGRVKNTDELHHRIGKALRSEGTAVIFKNGKAVASIHPSTYSATGKNVHSELGQETQQKSKWTRDKWRGGKVVQRGYNHKWNDPEFNTTDAKWRATHLLHGDGNVKDDLYKDHHVEVRGYAPDEEREKKHKERHPNDSWHREPTQFDKITDKAAEKLATKKLGAKESPLKTAQALHAKIGQHMAAGDHQKAERAIADLHNHVRTVGLSDTHPKIDSYARSLKRGREDMGLSSNWGKEQRNSEKEKRKEMRGESFADLNSKLGLLLKD